MQVRRLILLMTFLSVGGCKEPASPVPAGADDASVTIALVSTLGDLRDSVGLRDVNSDLRLRSTGTEMSSADDVVAFEGFEFHLEAPRTKRRGATIYGRASLMATDDSSWIMNLRAEDALLVPDFNDQLGHIDPRPYRKLVAKLQQHVAERLEDPTVFWGALEERRGVTTDLELLELALAPMPEPTTLPEACLQMQATIIRAWMEGSLRMPGTGVTQVLWHRWPDGSVLVAWPQVWIQEPGKYGLDLALFRSDESIAVAGDIRFIGDPDMLAKGYDWLTERISPAADSTN